MCSHAPTALSTSDEYSLAILEEATAQENQGFNSILSLPLYLPLSLPLDLLDYPLRT